MKLGINGLGRIGRLALRIALQRNINVSMLNDRNDLNLLIPLIKHDSVYGSFDFGTIPFRFYRSMPFPYWDCDVVLDCSGGGPDGNKSRELLNHGAKKVIISAPAPNVDAVLVYGVNHEFYDPQKHNVISMASCTTNCVAPITKILQEFRLTYLNIVSINAYTNAQRLVDAPHSDFRRARAANLNIIPTESSTLDSMNILFPDLKYDAFAYRVPVACGSVCHLNAKIDISLSTLKRAFLNYPYYKDVLAYEEDYLVSSDIIGDSHSAIIDGYLLRQNNGYIQIVAWYDNEWGYANRLCDLVEYICNNT